MRETQPVEVKYMLQAKFFCGTVRSNLLERGETEGEESLVSLIPDTADIHVGCAQITVEER